eukprot:gene4912-5388_t
MARANLNVDNEVIDKFLLAQEDSSNIRLLTIKIENESLIFHQEYRKVQSAEEDFNHLLPTIFTESEAIFGLYHAKDIGDGGSSGSGSGNHSSSSGGRSASWILLVWIPEGCRVRDKMLYSSSRDDFKKRLGLGYFQGDFAANELPDLTWENYQASQDRTFDPEVLTQTERLVLEEKVLTQSESNQVKSTALGVIPFAISDEVAEQFAAFKEGSVNWIEVTINNEVIELLHSRSLPSDGGFNQYVDDETASFIITKLEKSDGTSLSLFIYFCPENTPIRLKMTLSSSKASVLASAAEQGITFDRSLEVRGKDEVDDAILHELLPRGDSNSPTISSSAANLVHAKPSRPGKGKARVAKFQA